jgi:hypothetical protein
VLKETDEATGVGMEALVMGADATLRREVLAKYQLERCVDLKTYVIMRTFASACLMFY